MHIVLGVFSKRLGQPPINEIEAPSLYPLDIATALTDTHTILRITISEVFGWADG